MEVLRVISRLLDYPEESLYEFESDFNRIIINANIQPDLKDKLSNFVWKKLDGNMLDWQSEYDGLFERGRSLGLWLFEHVHGESRDRGQAMVDLLDQYRQAGLEISQHELPDYIPLFLEFIATQGDENAKQWLEEVAHILALLQARLEKRGSSYSILFECLLSIAGGNTDVSKINQQVEKETRDDTGEALDKEWLEEEVSFGADSINKNCSTARRKPTESQRADIDVPVHWVDFNSAESSNSSKAQFDEGKV